MVEAGMGDLSNNINGCIHWLEMFSQTLSLVYTKADFNLTTMRGLSFEVTLPEEAVESAKNEFRKLADTIHSESCKIEKYSEQLRERFQKGLSEGKTTHTPRVRDEVYNLIERGRNASNFAKNVVKETIGER